MCHLQPQGTALHTLEKETEVGHLCHLSTLALSVFLEEKD